MAASQELELERMETDQTLLMDQWAVVGVIWTEHTVVVLQAVVDLKGVVLPPDTLDLLLVQLDRHANYFAASLKFSSLMLSLVTKHGKQVRAQAACSYHKTTLANTLCRWKQARNTWNRSPPRAPPS
jgi:hypothetical protein